MLLAAALTFYIKNSVDIRIRALYDVRLGCWMSNSQHFEGLYCLYLHGQAIQEDCHIQKMEAPGIFMASGNT
jgi:hypothetical protein